jgi:serine/threonine protein kinase
MANAAPQANSDDVHSLDELQRLAQEPLVNMPRDQPQVPNKHDFHKLTDIDFAQEFATMEKIGHGFYGDVFHVHDRPFNLELAMKTVPHAQLHDKYTFVDLQREARLQEAMESPHVVNLVNTFQRENGDFVLLTELMKGGDLFHLIDWPNGGGLLNGWDIRDTFRQVVDAVRYFHENYVVHMDLKPSNFWCDEATKTVKIGDFGFAFVNEGKNTLLRKPVGTLEYMAPELFRSRERPCHPEPVDIWALGVTLYAMLTGRHPWPPYQGIAREHHFDLGNEFTMASQLDKYSYPALPETVSSDAKDLIGHMLNKDLSRRYNIHQIANHPYLTAMSTPREGSAANFQNQESHQQVVQHPFLTATPTPRDGSVHQEDANHPFMTERGLGKQ